MSTKRELYEKTWYYKEVQRLWFEIKNIFSSECMICLSTENLQLHHKYYTSDSVKPKSHNENGSATRRRKQEATDYPERFLLICLSCHNSIQPRRLGYRKSTAMDQRRLIE